MVLRMMILAILLALLLGALAWLAFSVLYRGIYQKAQQADSADERARKEAELAEEELRRDLHLPAEEGTETPVSVESPAKPARSTGSDPT